MLARRGFIDLGSLCHCKKKVNKKSALRPQINKTSPCPQNIDYTTPILSDFDDVDRPHSLLRAHGQHGHQTSTHVTTFYGDI